MKQLECELACSCLHSEPVRAQVRGEWRAGARGPQATGHTSVSGGCLGTAGARRGAGSHRVAYLNTARVTQGKEMAGWQQRQEPATGAGSRITNSLSAAAAAAGQRRARPLSRLAPLDFVRCTQVLPDDATTMRQTQGRAPLAVHQDGSETPGFRSCIKEVVLWLVRCLSRTCPQAQGLADAEHAASTSATQNDGTGYLVDQLQFTIFAYVPFIALHSRKA